MASSIVGDDFILWLLLFLICAPVAIIILAWDFYNRRKRPIRPVYQDFQFYK